MNHGQRWGEFRGPLQKTIIGMRLSAKLSQANNVVTAGRIILNDEYAYETGLSILKLDERNVHLQIPVDLPSMMIFDKLHQLIQYCIIQYLHMYI